MTSLSRTGLPVNCMPDLPHGGVEKTGHGSAMPWFFRLALAQIRRTLHRGNPSVMDIHLRMLVGITAVMLLLVGKPNFADGFSQPDHQLASSALSEVTVTPHILVPGGQATLHYHGHYADKPNLTIHYGFNGWNRISGIDDFEVEDDGGNKNYFKEVPMTKASDSGFMVTIDIPTAAKALHFVFYWQDHDSTRHWDNNDKKDYRKAVEIPYMGPYLTWNHNTRPDSGVVFNFQTGTATQTRIEYGLTPSLGTTLTGTASTEDHHMELTGLAGGTLYYYRVFGDNGTSSPIYSFKTAEANPTHVTFAVAADMQDNGDDRRWGDVANEIMANHADIDFMLVVGDMPWNDQPGHWWTFFDKGRQLLASKVIMPTVGNHDTPGNGSDPDTSSFEQAFDLPATSGSETYYGFSFGPAHFLSLNSEVPQQFTKGSGAQYHWIQNQIAALQNVSQRDWVFVYWHIPPYDAGQRHYREQGKFRDITALFDGTVDWVFNGHEHLYQRAKPLRYNAKLAATGNYGVSSDKGVGYLLVPPAGNHPESKLIPFDAPRRRYRDRLAFPRFGPRQNDVDSQIGFTKVAVAGDAIEIKTFGMGTLTQPLDSHIIDSVSYRK